MRGVYDKKVGLFSEVDLPLGLRNSGAWRSAPPPQRPVLFLCPEVLSAVQQAILEEPIAGVK
jgi:hypothetical protein